MVFLLSVNGREPCAACAGEPDLDDTLLSSLIVSGTVCGNEIITLNPLFRHGHQWDF